MHTSAVATCRNPVDTESLTCRKGAMGDLGGDDVGYYPIRGPSESQFSSTLDCMYRDGG